MMGGRRTALLFAFFAAAMSAGWAQPSLINENYRVPAQSSTAPTLIFEQNHVGSRIAGTVSVAEHDINFFVCDEANYQLWKSGSACSAIWDCGRCTNSTFSFKVGKPSAVRFVMDNSYSLLTSKDVALTVSLTAPGGGASGGQNAGEGLAKRDENGAALDAVPRIRGRDYHGTVKARRFQISDSVSRYAPILLDVDGDGNKDTVRVRFDQVAWVVDVRANGNRTEMELPVNDENMPDGVWVDLATSYLVSDTKPVLLVNTQVGVNGDVLRVYDISLTTRGMKVDTLLDARAGLGGSPVVLKPNRVEIYHCAHPDMLQGSYTWAGDHFVSEGGK